MPNSELRELQIALDRMRDAEGKGAADQLLTECANACADDDVRRIGKPLHKINGVGDMYAAEILAAVGREMCASPEPPLAADQDWARTNQRVRARIGRR